MALVLVTFVLAVSLRNDFVYFLLGFELMLYLAAFCQVLWLSKKIRVQVMLPESRVFRGEPFQIRAKLKNTSRLPAGQLMVRLAVRVFPEMEELLLKGKLMLDGREEGSLCFALDSSHCGCLEIRSDQLVVTDFMGIFQRRCPVEHPEKYMLFILPGALHTLLELPDVQGVFLDEDGDNESRGNSAIDVSEIRSYQKGDSLRRVHWKLTARLDELMVKEMMDPSEKLTWLYLNLQETAGSPGIRRDPNAWDHFVETAAAASAKLLQLEKRHMVLWIDSSDSRVVQNCVSDEMSLQEMLCGLLRTDSFLPGNYSMLLKEIYLDETKGTCIEIDLQGNFVRSKTP